MASNFPTKPKVLEMTEKADDKLDEMTEAMGCLKELGCQISSCGTLASDHIKSVNDVINAAYEEKLQHAIDRERDEIRVIREDAEEEIRIINEKKDKRIRGCQMKAGRQQQAIMEELAKVLTDTAEINMVVSKRLDELQRDIQRKLDTIDNMVNEMNRIKQSDETLVEVIPQIIASFDDCNWTNTSEDVQECLYRIKNEVQRVKFVEGEVGGEHYAKIDGFTGKWELVKSIEISPVIEYPRVCGVIRDDEICLRNWQNNDLYVTRISTGSTSKVVEGADGGSVTSCASVGNGLTVCGRRRDDCTGESLNGCVTIYDRDWKVVKDITIPRNPSANSQVYVDVGSDGMILAAQYGQSHIFIIDPSNCDVLDRVAMSGKEVRGEIQASLSGDIIVKTGYGEFVVVSRAGMVKAVINDDEWSKTGWSRCRVDKLTGALYVTYWDSQRNVCAIQEVSTDDNNQVRGVIEYVESNQSYVPRPFVLNPCGKVLTCDGQHIYVYKKSFAT